MFTTIISPNELADHIEDLQWLIVDCRFALSDPNAGYENYQTKHIPGAVYAHLNEDLSSPVIPGVTGRHPLPSPEHSAKVFGRLGIGPNTQVVVYDDMGGALAASRLWWMLHWLGHEPAAVLDGGWQAWQQAGLPTHSGIETRQVQTFIPHPQDQFIANAEDVDIFRQSPTHRVLDARSADRFRGENETIDLIAGHILGAVNAPFAYNLTEEGNFGPADELRDYYQNLLGDTATDQVVVYCGSGVTAAHDILAIRIAGLGMARLYPGSWSEWITIAGRAIAK